MWLAFYDLVSFLAFHLIVPQLDFIVWLASLLSTNSIVGFHLLNRHQQTANLDD
ncbi:MAG: hypothetical protein ACI936_003462 [Paraglaciecola sp.]|jgi:hypothetical protein